MRLLVTGGAGFVGSSLALGLKLRHPDWSVTALDNLKRRGSELNLPRLSEGGVVFVHGDIRVRGDLAATGPCDLLLECSAEPSVLAGLDGSPDYVLETNLGGTIHCLEHVRRHGAGMIFLSTSRVYPIVPLVHLPLRETESRYELDAAAELPPGATEAGISEDFTLTGSRSLYGATKLASELLAAEYVDAFRVPVVVDRCGVLAGPWQMGRIDQGIVGYWAASHVFERPLRYIGFEGKGKQVRDLLHVDDLLDLVERQLLRVEELSGRTYNVGGGRVVSVSLRELTELCVAASGRRVPIVGEPEARRADVPVYLTDAGRVQRDLGWSPRRSAEQIVTETVAWVEANRDALQRVLGPAPG